MERARVADTEPIGHLRHVQPLFTRPLLTKVGGQLGVGNGGQTDTLGIASYQPNRVAVAAKEVDHHVGVGQDAAIHDQSSGRIQCEEP